MLQNRGRSSELAATVFRRIIRNPLCGLLILVARYSSYSGIVQLQAMTETFHTTQWSVVLAAGDGQQDRESQRALETLCQTYWAPLYAYVRHKVRNDKDAQHLIQAFFERLLEKETLTTADPRRGRFRTFLLTACERFLINEWQKGNALKRG